MKTRFTFKMNINITPIYVRFRWILQVYRFIGMTSSKWSLSRRDADTLPSIFRDIRFRPGISSSFFPECFIPLKVNRIRLWNMKIYFFQSTFLPLVQMTWRSKNLSILFLTEISRFVIIWHPGTRYTRKSIILLIY